MSATSSKNPPSSPRTYIGDLNLGAASRLHQNETDQNRTAFYAAWRATSTAWAVAIGFVWGGAIGNLIDRLFADPGFGRGHVTDFLAYGNLFIGNIADIAIGIGVGLGILQVLLSHRSQTRSEHPGATSPQEK